MAQLCPYKDEIDKLAVNVLLITFSSVVFAERFKEEVCSAFSVLINRERDVCWTHVLESFFLRSWGPKNLWGYVQKLIAGESWQAIQGGSAQLGGDFIVDREGIVRYAYRSEDPTDRPPVEKLADVLRDRTGSGQAGPRCAVRPPRTRSQGLPTGTRHSGLRITSSEFGRAVLVV